MHREREKNYILRGVFFGGVFSNEFIYTYYNKF